MTIRVSAIAEQQYRTQPVFEEKAGWRILQNIQAVASSNIMVCDLSHRPKAIVIGPDMDPRFFSGKGRAQWHQDAWYAGLSRDEGHYYNLLGDLNPVRLPAGAVDMTDAWTLMAVYGNNAKKLMARLVTIDIDPFLEQDPCFFATRVHNAKVYILNMRNNRGFLMACDRSFGHDLYEMCFNAPAFLGIQPAVERDFHVWLKSG